MIGILQVKAHRALQFYVSREVKKFGLTPTQWFVLGQIDKSRQIRPADIAGLLKVEAPLITSLTDELQKKGLINKVPHPTDKRVKLLELTAKSRELIPIIEASLQTCLKDLIKGVSPAELRTYEKVLKTIVANSQL